MLGYALRGWSAVVFPYIDLHGNGWREGFSVFGGKIYHAGPMAVTRTEYATEA